MLKKRNASGLAMNAIIVAIIGLIVLVVLMVMFSEKSGESIEILGSCGARGGDCSKSSCDEGERVMLGGKCEGTNPNPCCIGTQ